MWFVQNKGNPELAKWYATWLCEPEEKTAPIIEKSGRINVKIIGVKQKKLSRKDRITVKKYKTVGIENE